MHLTPTRRRLTTLRMSAVVSGVGLLVGALGGTGILPLPTPVWIAAMIVTGAAVGVLWGLRSAPMDRDLADAHAALIARCEHLTGQTNPYMAVDAATKQSVAVRRGERYTITVGSIDGDIGYDPDTMRNLHFATVTTYYLSIRYAGATKRVEAAAVGGDEPDRFMDQVERQSHSDKELRAIAEEAGSLLFATPDELRRLTTLLDTARPIQPPADE